MNPRQHPCVAAILVSVLLVTPGLCKKNLNPEDFKIEANVVEVASQQFTKGTSTTHPVLPSYCSDPKTSYEKAYCQTAGAAPATSTVEQGTNYVMTTEINDKIYDLQGPRLELGNYHVRFTEASRRTPAGIEFLLKDKKGNPVAVGYTIVGERLKKSRE